MCYPCGVLAPITLTPIGVVRTPFADRVSAPRQPYAARGARGTIELSPGRDFEHALSDLEGWDRLWVVFAFHLNPPGAWRPKVLPPRSAGKRRGVFSTRSPHRPNPIGLSVVRLDAVRGLSIDVSDVDCWTDCSTSENCESWVTNSVSSVGLSGSWFFSCAMSS